jgi:hypothetical protein
MKRLGLATAVVAAALAMSMPGAASASSPGCFGQFVSSSAQNPAALGAPNLGQFISDVATLRVPFGQNLIPVYKGFACGE